MEGENDDAFEGGELPVFELHGGTGAMKNRIKDVFGCLDELEVKHKAFEQTRATEDADADSRLIQEGPNSEDMDETINSKFKHPGALTAGRDYHGPGRGSRHTRIGHNVEFKKPMPPQRGGCRGQTFRGGRFGRGRTPDYKINPDRWTEYSLEDVDVSDTANKKAAFSFLQEQRALQETDAKEIAADLETSACSKGQIVFKKRSKAKSEDTKQDKTRDKATSALSVDMEAQNEDISGGGDIEMEDEDVKSKSIESEVKVEKQSLKRKLDELEEKDSSGEASSSEKQVEFKSRKSSKRQIRSRRDRDEDSD